MDRLIGRQADRRVERAMCAGYTLKRTGTYARKDACTQACTRARAGKTHDAALELALGVDDRVVQHGHRRDDVPAAYSEYSHRRVVQQGHCRDGVPRGTPSTHTGGSSYSMGTHRE
jgi:hypothetical protein